MFVHLVLSIQEFKRHISLSHSTAKISKLLSVQYLKAKHLTGSKLETIVALKECITLIDFQVTRSKVELKYDSILPSINTLSSLIMFLFRTRCLRPWRYICVFVLGGLALRILLHFVALVCIFISGMWNVNWLHMFITSWNDVQEVTYFFYFLNCADSTLSYVFLKFTIWHVDICF